MNKIQKLEEALEHPRAHEILAIIVILNAIVLGLETSETVKASQIYPYLVWMDHTFLGIFCFEMIVRLFAGGWNFFKSGWNIFDVTVISVPSSC